MALSRLKLSGSTDGKPIAVAAVASPGTTIHTAVGGTVNWDEIYLFVNNVTAANAKLSLEWGGVAGVGDRLLEQYTVGPYSALICVVPGLILDNGLVVKAFSDVASALNISGYVNRITP